MSKRKSVRYRPRGHLPVIVLVALLTTGTALIAPAAAKPPASTAAAPAALDLAAHRGEVVVVDFWASWCGPCRVSLPWLAATARKHAERGLTVITVNLDREREAADRFLSGLEMALPVVYDPEGEIARTFDLQGMPSSFVYDRGGRLRASHLGFDPEDAPELEDELLALLAEEVDHAH